MPLGVPVVPRRIDDVEGPLAAAASTRRGLARRRAPASRRAPCPARARPARCVARRAAASQQRPRGGVDKQQPGLRIGQHRRKLLRRRPTAPAAPPPRRRAARPGTRPHSAARCAAQIAIAVARPHAVALQRRGHAVHQRVELGVVDALVALHQGRLRAGARRHARAPGREWRGSSGRLRWCSSGSVDRKAPALCPVASIASSPPLKVPP